MEKSSVFEYFVWNSFDEFWTIATGFTGIVGILLVVLQLGYVAVQVKRARRQFELAQAGETSRIFFEVMDRWSDQYANRCSLLAKPPIQMEELIYKYGRDASKLLEDKVWQNEIRPILNFFEFLGVLLSMEKLDQDEILERIFTLVTVDNYPNKTLEKEHGTLYCHLQPYLTYLRSDEYTGYRADIYKYYDQVLIPKYIAYQKENHT